MLRISESYATLFEDEAGDPAYEVPKPPSSASIASRFAGRS